MSVTEMSKAEFVSHRNNRRNQSFGLVTSLIETSITVITVWGEITGDSESDFV